ncbi:Chaperone protein DnaJ [Candidatus Phytoplasma australiense]|uniref:Chaperone protein DnaJ n=2 Tax=Phytoplasma australiense TaxID=59748 RepID=B1VAB5_PHYAS|nr:molecular chaperone DnaJ [Candidatus Phytoplasma australiense]AGL90274.1 Chaperone protein dnaJ [Strawberry lethal yellows phytoplasma (CPA) str. NZSb11]CAM11888.1 Chaperone protein DnaJ [Candidatus Phytoplasma australiense]
MTKKDYYQVLGLNKEATPKEIKKAYLRLAKKYHPDVSQEANAEANFKEIQEAYSVLSDANKKANYDRFGHDSQTQQQGFSGFEGFEENIFNSFSDFFGTNKRSRKVNYDKKVEMTISFMDAVLGALKNIDIMVDADCQVCQGKGALSSSDIVKCRHCNGLGQVITEQRTFLGNIRSQQTCPYCRGEGEQIKNKCYSCHGSKRQKKKQSVSFQIPAGIEEGMSFQIHGKGNFPPLSNQAGDLYINFKIRPHESFVRKNQDIVLEIFINVPEAVLGTNKLIPTIYGEVNLKIPSGIQSGNKLRMKNQGIAYLNSSYRKGDQYVVVHVKIPSSPTLEEKRLYLKLLQLSN